MCSMCLIDKKNVEIIKDASVFKVSAKNDSQKAIVFTKSKNS